MTEPASAVVTILFTDLVNSTDLLSRAGDEEAQRVFRTHHDLLADTAAAHGGEEVKWLGDGLMVAFSSAANAVRAAVAMQQASRRPVRGERLTIRVGLNAGEAMRDAADWFGLPVVIARRLCDGAGGGEIRCTEVVTSLLTGRPEFAFTELGPLDLKGVAKPVGAYSVEYRTVPATGLAARAVYVGRDRQLDRLAGRLADATGGSGGVVVVAGDAGIGKTRLVEELAEQAARQRASVLWGHCFEGDWTPPYAAFAEALATAFADEPEAVRADLGAGGAALAQLVPDLRQLLPDLPDVVPLSPDEERFRLLDAAGQYLVARSRRTPVVLCLDDLHWADQGTLGMFRTVARMAARHRILILGTYRDAEVGEDHPLTQTLRALPRETTFERIHLDGLGAAETAELLSALGEHDVDARIGAAWAAETDGNPFFIGELLRHLIEEGHLYRGADGRWQMDRRLRDLDLPETVRDVITRRLSRLSDDARQLLQAACAFEGPFRFDVTAATARLDDNRALDAVDEALAAQLLLPGGAGDTYLFHHALIRHTLYSQLGQSRRLRLHRQVAEALERASGDRPSATQAGEIAAQYHRSADLPGAERGVEPALAAADSAQASGAHDEAVRFLRMALDLLPDADARRPRLLARLGIVLAWALAFNDAVGVAIDAAERLAGTEGNGAAADYLADAMYACWMAGGPVAAWTLAGRGLAYTDRRDLTWARLVSFDYERRAAEDPDYPGIPLDSPERRESARIIRQLGDRDPMAPAPMEAVYDSGAEALESTNLTVLTYWAGEYRRALPLYEAETAQAEALGRLARAARGWSYITTLRIALGDLAGARSSLEQAEALAARLGQPMPQLLTARDLLAWTLDVGWAELAATLEAITASPDPGLAWALGGLRAALARALARMGKVEKALTNLRSIAPWLDRAPAWANAFAMIPCHAADTLWLLERTDGADIVEAALRDKVVGPDFRSANLDGRLSLARLCAVTGRLDEAVAWFDEARRVLAEQGATPLLAICDYDEAVVQLRSGRPERARARLDAAHLQFERIGMTSWIRRADELAARL